MRLSAVMPVWNEEDVIGGLVEEVDREVLSRFESAELIVVDDASTDGTAAILDRLARERPRVDVRRSERNLGHGPSVVRGLAAARGEWVFQLDSDGQLAVSDFWTLWERREDADLVLGVRQGRRDPRHRLALSRVVATVVSALAGRRLRDPNTPIRLLRRELLDDVRPLLDESVLAPSIFVATAAAVRGWRVLEVPVGHRARETGRSSLRAGRLVRFSVLGLAQLVAFRVGRLRRARP
jgi:glycosyltransferase involved in cell wall biosynthesis